MTESDAKCFKNFKPRIIVSEIFKLLYDPSKFEKMRFILSRTNHPKNPFREKFISNPISTKSKYFKSPLKHTDKRNIESSVKKSLKKIKSLNVESISTVTLSTTTNTTTTNDLKFSVSEIYSDFMNEEVERQNENAVDSKVSITSFVTEEVQATEDARKKRAVLRFVLKYLDLSKNMKLIFIIF